MYLGGQVMAARKKFDVQYPNLYGKLDNIIYDLHILYFYTYIVLTISFNIIHRHQLHPNIIRMQMNSTVFNVVIKTFLRAMIVTQS